MVIFAYDGALRFRGRTDQKGDVITWTYDLPGRMTTKNYPSGVNDAFTYDTDSRMLTAASGLYNNTLTFTYDPAGRMASESLTVNFGTPQTYTVQRGYDTRNLLTQITYPNGSIVDRTFTARAQLQQASYNTNMVAQFTYDPGLRETSRTFGNSIVTTRAYNRADNLVTNINTAADAALSFAYTYDANKNPTSETTGGVMANYSWSTPVGGYDNEDRLINWQRSIGFTQQWNLSLVGDWNINTINSIAETRTHNDVHEILTVTPGNPQTTLLHDAKGNLSRDEKNQLYTWDYNNHQSQAVNTAGETWTYTYDALGRRVSKSVTTKSSTGGIGSVGTGTGTTTTTTTTVYVCLSQIVQGKPCGQEIAEYNANSAPTSPLRMYVFGEYIDEPLAQITPQGLSYTTHYYHQNRQYCVMALTDNLGGVIERYAYTAYGVTTILAPDGVTPRTTSLYANAYLFTGRRLDPETNNYYFRARYHSPTLGRFIMRDSLGYLDNLSLYSYVSENPIQHTDPSGFQHLAIESDTAVVFIGNNNDAYFVGTKESPSSLVTTMVSGGRAEIDIQTLQEIADASKTMNDFEANLQTQVQNSMIFGNGTRAADYYSGRVTSKECCDLGAEAARQLCHNRMQRMHMLYLGQAVAKYLGPTMMGLAATATGITFTDAGTKGKNPVVVVAGALVTAAGTAVTAVSVAEFEQTRTQLELAAKYAEEHYCDCDHLR